MQQGIKAGLLAFAALTYLILIGLPGSLGELAFPVLAVAAALLFYLSLRRPCRDRPARTVLVTGTTAGVIAGLLTLALIACFAVLLGNGVRVQPILDKIVPLNIAALLGVSAGTVASGEVPLSVYLARLLMMTIAGTAGAGSLLLFRSSAVHTVRRTHRPGARWLVIVLPFVLFGLVYLLGQDGMRLFGNARGTVRLLIAMLAVGSGLFALRSVHAGRERAIVSILLIVLMLLLPLTLDRFQNSVMGIVFIFVMMGLGLNIVVGFAGLLDLGYVAFFAIGAYVYAFLSAPFSSPWISSLLVGMGISPQSPLLNYWMAVPLTMITAAIGGVLLGIPVLRLRGDYLAIVTLGFGEIIRLFMLNLSELTNGPRGLLNISPPALGSYGLGDPQGIFYLALLGSALIAFVAYRLNDSRLGRAWVAMREDEDVAQATGIHLVRTKLLAFAIGATFAGMAGQLYAARQVNIFPENFSLFVSIDALSLIIVGGMGSIPGVVLGALALKGLPEVLRGVDEYRIIAFAALLVIMMIVRPEGILPSARRRQELEGQIAAQGPPIETQITASPEGVTANQQPEGGRA